MRITLLCNAGLALETERSMLLVDLPNLSMEPFYALPENEWRRICGKEAPYDKVCGFYFTHDHPDHLDAKRLSEYPDSAVKRFIPDNATSAGAIEIGDFLIEYCRFEHAPIPQAPPHVVSLISSGGKSVYVAADAALECEKHREFLGGRKVDAAIWNSMYLSRADTRMLMADTAQQNYIYHMPLKPDSGGIWKKCEKNLQRHGDELQTVTVMKEYPQQWDV